jgi:hypothetical protein
VGVPSTRCLRSFVSENERKAQHGHAREIARAFHSRTAAIPDMDDAGLDDGYEISSGDNPRSLVVFPLTNSFKYEEYVFPGGFRPGAAYEPELEGHSWFVSRLLSHALFHSNF